jgi:hypothetical protein
MNNTMLKLALSTIANFRLYVMQHGKNMKEHIDIESNINKHIKLFNSQKASSIYGLAALVFFA